MRLLHKSIQLLPIFLTTLPDIILSCGEARPGCRMQIVRIKVARWMEICPGDPLWEPEENEIINPQSSASASIDLPEIVSSSGISKISNNGNRSNRLTRFKDSVPRWRRSQIRKRRRYNTGRKGPRGRPIYLARRKLRRRNRKRRQ